MQISPAKKEKLKSSAAFADLHPRYPAGHPQGGKFMPKGSADYVNAVAKNTGKSPQEVKKALGDSGNAKPSVQPSPQGKKEYTKEEIAKEVQAQGKNLVAALDAQYQAEQAKLNAGKGAKREASKALTAAKKEVSAQQKAVEAVLLKHGASSKEKARQIAEKLIAQKMEKLKGEAKPVEKVAPKVEAKTEKKSEAIAPKAKAKTAKKADFSQGKSLVSGIALDGSDDSGDSSKKRTFKTLDKAAAKISEATGLSKEESQKTVHALVGFTDLDYKTIRANEKVGKPFVGEYYKSDPSFVEEKDQDYDRIKVINNFLDKAPKYEGTVYRGLVLPDKKAVDKFLKSIKAGEALDAMSSTTSNPDIAKNFASDSNDQIGVVMNIKNKSGVSIKTLSKHHYEDEVLVPRGALYKASKVTKSIGENGKEFYTIDVDEIDHENQQSRRDSRKKK